MKVFAKFDEIPSMILEVIKETKRYGHMFGRAVVRSDKVKTIYPPTNTVCGGYNYKILTAFECVLFWSLALSEALLKDFCTAGEFTHTKYLQHLRVSCSDVWPCQRHYWILTAFKCVLFWCLALSEALLKDFCTAREFTHIKYLQHLSVSYSDVWPCQRHYWRPLYSPGTHTLNTYSIWVCPVLMFGPVRGITEGLCTARELTHVGLFSGIAMEMMKYLQRLIASCSDVWPCPRHYWRPLYSPGTHTSNTYCVRVSPILMFGPVRGTTEGLCAA